MIRIEKLKFYVDNGYNVLFIGHAGVGKTAVVKQVFDKYFKNWKYFSASTLDPWVDFVGVPKERVDEATGTAYLDLVRPYDFAHDNIEAIFVDEYNRSSKKLRNAIMELIQFKSINGKKFNNLKVVWAAINPDDDSYDVEKLDPAQLDRFHVQIQVPYEPNLPYFQEKYDKNGELACEWWNKLPEPDKKLVSPRRLDYALDIYHRDGDVRDILPASSNPDKLSKMLIKQISYVKILNRLMKEEKTEEATKFISDPNNCNHCLEDILQNNKLYQFYFPLFPEEVISKLVSEYEQLGTSGYAKLIKAVEIASSNERVAGVLFEIMDSNNNIKAKIQQICNKFNYTLVTKHNLEKVKAQKWGASETSWTPVAPEISEDYTLDRLERDSKSNQTFTRTNAIVRLSKSWPNNPDLTKIYNIILNVISASQQATITKETLAPQIFGVIQKFLELSKETHKKTVEELFADEYAALYQQIVHKNLVPLIKVS